jgi:hypothetical protein
MHDNTKRTRLRFGVASLVALIALVAMAAFAGAAQAGTSVSTQTPGLVGLDPQNANVPYLAWRGNQVRLVKCIAGTAGLLGRFVIEDWSGDPFQRPQFENPSFIGGEAQATGFAGTGEQAGRTCFAQDIVSLKAGLAIVKLTIGGEDGVTLPADKHQFLVAWMGINSAAISDIGPTTLTAGSGTPNQIRVDVTGDIPMNGNFDEVNAQLGRPAGQELVMPNDWDDLASIMARSTYPGHERDPLLWDIHDDQAATEGHWGANTCSPRVSTGIDAVDNCAPGDAPDDPAFGDELGPFSNIGNYTSFNGEPGGVQGFTTAGETIGPFDPLRPADTYLPDGKTDPGDAPMPSIRVDFAIQPNTPGGINGVGFLGPVDKHQVYSHDAEGDEGNDDPATDVPCTGTLVPGVTCENETDYLDDPHNLYAPFYATFLPATSAQAAGPITNTTPLANGVTPIYTGGLGETSSGVDGPATGNNYHGFLNNGSAGGFYHYWDFATALSRTGAATNCQGVLAGGGDPVLVTNTEPSGIREVTVYTDEHGETRVDFFAGTGFFFDNLGGVGNANAGCDLQGINPLGTAVISAIARYPYQPVTAADVPAGTVAKTVVSAFNKEVTCVPKGPGTANSVAWICTASAFDITGAPFTGETVCFATNAEAMFPYNTAPVIDPRGGVQNRVCVVLGDDGTASVEILGKGTLNVIADFVDEGLLRFVTFAGTPLTPGTGTAPAPAPTTSTLAPTPQQVASVTGVAPSAPKPEAKTPEAIKRSTLSFARLVYTTAGRSIVVRVNGTNKTAKVRIVMRSGTKKVATAVRTVRTNRTVKVANLRIAKRVTRINVSVLS